jgi:hypothetical protein
MEQDLCDLMSAWLGGDLEESRHAPLLDRLNADADFRTAFVGEIRMLGMLKAVQSTEPRWLRLEDTLGWSASNAPAEEAFEDRVARRLPRADRPRARWLRRAGVGILAAALAAGLLVWLLRAPAVPASTPGDAVAVVVKLEGATPAEHGGPPAEGSVLTAGPFRLDAGRATLSFVGGVTLVVEGPAEIELTSAREIFCRRGKFRSQVAPGAEGFIIRSPGAAAVDLGTELGLNIESDGTTNVLIFEGKAAVSVLNPEGDTVSNKEIDSMQAVAIDPKAGRISDVAAHPEQFAAAPTLRVAPLALDAAYPAAVLASGPRGYWRFESLENGVTPNEIPDGPPFKAVGPIRLAGADGGNHAVVFPPRQKDQYLLMDGTWTPKSSGGHAVEFWCLSETISGMAVLSLIAKDDDPVEKHLLLLQLTAQHGDCVHQPGALRYLHRWPPGIDGGINLFSRHVFIPHRWHHLVAQQGGDGMELYLDGELTGRAPIDRDDTTAACEILLGRLKVRPLPTPHRNQVRSFVGQLDELAVYDHILTAAEVRQHYELGSAVGRKP